MTETLKLIESLSNLAQTNPKQRKLRKTTYGRSEGSSAPLTSDPAVRRLTRLPLSRVAPLRTKSSGQQKLNTDASFIKVRRISYLFGYPLSWLSSQFLPFAYVCKSFILKLYNESQNKHIAYTEKCFICPN